MYHNLMNGFIFFFRRIETCCSYTIRKSLSKTIMMREKRIQRSKRLWKLAEMKTEIAIWKSEVEQQVHTHFYCVYFSSKNIFSKIINSNN